MLRRSGLVDRATLAKDQNLREHTTAGFATRERPASNITPLLAALIAMLG
jgi:hypothetical protein